MRVVYSTLQHLNEGAVLVFVASHLLWWWYVCGKRAALL